MKPAESGCPRADGELVPDDGVLLRKAAGLDGSDPGVEALPIEAVVPHRLATPVAPGVAARLEGAPFEWARVVAAREKILSRRPDLFLVEGAGGLLVPYTDDLLACDVAARLELPLLIVAHASLGTINHTLLTVFEARRRGLAVAGVILNRVSPDSGPDEATNASEIERLGRVPVLGTVPHIPEKDRRDPQALALAVEFAFDPERLRQVTTA